MLFSEPVRINHPFLLIRGPFQVKMALYLRDELAYFHDTDILAKAHT